MTRQLKLVRLDDFISDIDSLDLLSGGFTLARDGYQPKACAMGDTSAVETLTLQIQGTTQDDVASKLHSLDDKIKQACWWADDPGVERYQVWLRVQLDNESYPRQAQIIKITPPDKVKIFTPEEFNGNWLGQYILGIERTPWWEMPYPYPTTTAKTGINAIGGTATLSETIHGDVPARLSKLEVYPPDSISPNSDYWLGWKSNRFGVAANFQPVWDLKDAISLSLSADTSVVVDASARSGSKLTCTFGTTATLSKRCTSGLGSSVTTGDLAAQRGSYTVLLRAKMSDTSIARARLEFGFAASYAALTNTIIRSRQVISGTSWFLYEMGSVDIPPLRIYSTNTLSDFLIQLYAERISGAGSLDIDCLIFIPIDEGMVKLNSPAGSGDSVTSIYVFQHADNSLGSFMADNGGISPGLIRYTVIAKPVNQWSLPANDDSPVLVAAAQDITAGNVKGKTFSMAYTYSPRWRTLRGNET